MITEAQALAQARARVDDAWSAHDPCQADALLQAALEQLERSPGTARALTCRGAILCDLGRHAEASILLRRALQLDATDGNTHFNLAIACLNLGDHDEASRHFRAASTSQRDSQTWTAFFDPHAH